MPTKSPAAFPPPSIHLHDPDPPDDDHASSNHSSEQPAPRQHDDDPQLQQAPDLAQRRAPTILLAMGIAVFALGFVGCAAYVISHSTIAAIFVVLGLLAVVVSPSLDRLVLIKLNTRFGELMAKFGLKGSDNDGPGSDGAPDV
jgi:hypothetical protein